MELFKENKTIEEVREFPTLTLAHIGDGVYELLARSYVINSGVFKASDNHKKTVAIVSAEAQYDAAQSIFDILHDDEKSVFIRGRNSKPKSVPKHAGIKVYAHATGLEALFGYLYLLGRNARIGELWAIISQGFTKND